MLGAYHSPLGGSRPERRDPRWDGVLGGKNTIGRAGCCFQPSVKGWPACNGQLSGARNVLLSRDPLTPSDECDDPPHLVPRTPCHSRSRQLPTFTRMPASGDSSSVFPVSKSLSIFQRLSPGAHNSESEPSGPRLILQKLWDRWSVSESRVTADGSGNVRSVVALRGSGLLTR